SQLRDPIRSRGASNGRHGTRPATVAHVSVPLPALYEQVPCVSPRGGAQSAGLRPPTIQAACNFYSGAVPRRQPYAVDESDHRHFDGWVHLADYGPAARYVSRTCPQARSRGRVDPDRNGDGLLGPSNFSRDSVSGDPASRSTPFEPGRSGLVGERWEE